MRKSANSEVLSELKHLGVVMLKSLAVTIVVMQMSRFSRVMTEFTLGSVVSSVDMIWCTSGMCEISCRVCSMCSACSIEKVVSRGTSVIVMMKKLKMP